MIIDHHVFKYFLNTDNFNWSKNRVLLAKKTPKLDPFWRTFWVNLTTLTGPKRGPKANDTTDNRQTTDNNIGRTSNLRSCAQ